MDTTETDIAVEQPADLLLTNDAKYFLNTAARWANFLGILGFIFTGLTVLSALSCLAMGGTVAALTAQQAESAPIPPVVATVMGLMSSVGVVIFLIYAAIQFFFSFYLVRFAGNSKKAVLYNSTADMTKGIENLKSFFKLGGIITIIMIALSILSFIGVILFAVSMASAVH